MKKLLFVTDARFGRTGGGDIYAVSQIPPTFFQKYATVWDTVTVLTRIVELEQAPGSGYFIDGQNLRFRNISNYDSIFSYWRLLPTIKKIVSEELNDADGIILRVPSTHSSAVVSAVRRKGRPFGLEVSGDPYDTFSPGSMGHPLRPFFRWYFARQLKKQCAWADGVLYVTQSALQKRYPASPRAITAYCSNVELRDEDYAESRSYSSIQSPLTLLHVGSMSQPYKSHDVSIDAVSMCLAKGIQIRLVLVGDGKHRPEYERRVQSLGLGERIVFRGQMPAGLPIRDEMDRADLFVLPSRAEGLPRALIEAMARGLPCIGTNVGGIPELLDPIDLVPPGDAVALSRKIEEVVSDPRWMEAMSSRNRRKALEYRYDVLMNRREEFYRALQETFEARPTQES